MDIPKRKTYFQPLESESKVKTGLLIDLVLPDPVGSALPLPIHLYIEVVETIQVQFDYSPDVAIMDLLVRSTTPNGHPSLHKERKQKCMIFSKEIIVGFCLQIIRSQGTSNFPAIGLRTYGGRKFGK